MARRPRFIPEWKFKINTCVHVPELRPFESYITPSFTGIVLNYRIYSRSNVRYICKRLSAGLIQEWDKKHLEDHAKKVDVRTAKLLYGIV